VGEGLAYLVSGVSGFRLAKKALSGFTKRIFQKARARANKIGSGGIQEPGSSGAPLRCPVASTESAVEISAKDRDEPVVQNLPEANGWLDYYDTATHILYECEALAYLRLRNLGQ
jgi:hypothetical protein